MNFNLFQEPLQTYPPESIVFVGVGNTMRSDDSAGLILLQRLRELRTCQKSHFIQAGTNPENHLQTILDLQPEAVVFIDAARLGQPPGTIQWLSKNDLDRIRISTHAFSISLIEEYILSHIPVRFYYLGIEPESTAPGTDLSASVLAGINALIGRTQMRESY